MSKLKERSENAKNKTNNSVEMAKQSFETASNIYVTLQNFKEVLDKNLYDATEASRNINDIEINVSECRIIMDGVKRSLTYCEQNNKQVAEFNQQSDRLIENIQKVKQFEIN